MSLFTTRARLASPPLHGGRCASPPLSATAAFFDPPRAGCRTCSASPAAALGPLSPSPSLCAGFSFDRLVEEDEPPSAPVPGWRRRGEWTPLTARYASQAHSGGAEASEDRLERLLREVALESPSALPGAPPPVLAPAPALQPQPPAECWERRRLETRFHPIRPAGLARPCRPCLKRSHSSNTRSSSSSVSSTSSSVASLSESHDESPQEMELNMDQASGESVRVRFDDELVEEILTWSSESYDRKGPQPITKLNIREVIELRLIKEELASLGSSKPTAV